MILRKHELEYVTQLLKNLQCALISLEKKLRSPEGLAASLPLLNPCSLPQATPALNLQRARHTAASALVLLWVLLPRGLSF